MRRDFKCQTVQRHTCALSPIQLFATNSVARQPPLSMGFPRQESWGGLPFPPPGESSNPEIEPVSPALTGGFFTIEPPGKLYSKGMFPFTQTSTSVKWSWKIGWQERWHWWFTLLYHLLQGFLGFLASQAAHLPIVCKGPCCAVLSHSVMSDSLRPHGL